MFCITTSQWPCALTSHLRVLCSEQPTAERTFTIGVFIVGAVFFSTIYGNIQNFVQRMNKINDRYSNRMFEVNEFIKFHRCGASDFCVCLTQLILLSSHPTFLSISFDQAERGFGGQDPQLRRILVFCHQGHQR